MLKCLRKGKKNLSATKLVRVYCRYAYVVVRDNTNTQN